MLTDDQLIQRLSKLPSTRKEAVALGEKFYWNPAKPRCSRGHLSPKYAARWTCRECMTGSPLPEADGRKPTPEQVAAKASEKAAKKQLTKAKAARARADQRRAEQDGGPGGTASRRTRRRPAR